ncbi:MAG: SDR family oxidoreductase [Myxococcales bacterium]|nr:MAG: SDR family oxidoreductase [Myxococcales bacterium]
MAQSGAKVAVHFHHSESGAADLVQELTEAGSQAKSFQADLFDQKQCQALIDEVIAFFGRLDVLVCNAANFERVELDAIAEEHWNRALELNLKAPFWLAQHAVKELKARQGAIVLLSCASTIKPFRHYLPYLMSKAGVFQLTKTLALELAPDVRVNAVAPGAVLPPPEMQEDTVQRLLKQVPLGKLGRAEDIADAVLFLATAPFVTGHQLVVDGGEVAGDILR